MSFTKMTNPSNPLTLKIRLEASKDQKVKAHIYQNI